MVENFDKNHEVVFQILEFQTWKKDRKIIDSWHPKKKKKNIEME